MAEPNGQLSAERDEAGRFLRGNTISKTGGRPRGIDIKALAEEMAEQEGYDLRQAMWRVLKTLINSAEAGDVAAAKIVFERLGVDDDLMSRAGVVLHVLTGLPRVDAP